MIPGMLVILMSLLVTEPGAPTDGVATAGFRAEHKHIHAQLDETAALVGKLATLPGEGQKAAMAKIIDFFVTGIVPHAGFEEEVLYPLVDQHAGTEVNRFTASMRHEHKIVERWIGDLQKIATDPAPDINAFTRKADNLIGLIVAHFEEEEEVLLPVLDKTMTADQFEKAMHGAEHEGK